MKKHLLMILLILHVSCSNTQESSDAMEVTEFSGDLTSDILSAKSNFGTSDEYNTKITEIFVHYNRTINYFKPENTSAEGAYDKSTEFIQTEKNVPGIEIIIQATPIFRTNFIPTQSATSLSIRNVQSTTYYLADPVMVLFECRLQKFPVKTLQYIDDSSDLNPVINAFLVPGQEYTILIHAYNELTSGTGDLYINDDLIKKDIYFGGYTHRRYIASGDIVNVRSQVTSNFTDPFILILLKNENTGIFEVVRYDDDRYPPDAMIINRGGTITNGYGYVLVGAYSELTTGSVRYEYIRGAMLYGFPK